MGLMDDFGVNPDEVKASTGFSNPDDGVYDFTIDEALSQKGTSNRPTDNVFIIKYNLDEGGQKWEYFTVGEDDDPSTEAAQRGLGNLKRRMVELGLDPKTADAEDFEGLTGTLKLVTTKKKVGNEVREYQNIRNLKVTAQQEPVAKTAAKANAATAKKATAAKAATEPAAADDSDDNPFV